MKQNYDSVYNSIGKWNHIMLVQSYNTKNTAFKKYNYSHYFNGKKMKDPPGSGSDSEENPMAIKLSLGGFIGRSIGPLNFFSGSIDDVRIYDRALSDDEILQLYNLKY
jgi:Concanavalin A-like lectin/glucanases superfamily